MRSRLACCIFLTASTTLLLPLYGEAGEAAGAAGSLSSVFIVTLFANAAIVFAADKSVDQRRRSFALVGEPPSGGESTAAGGFASGAASVVSVLLEAVGLAAAGEFESGGVAKRGILLTPSEPWSFRFAAFGSIQPAGSNANCSSDGAEAAGAAPGGVLGPGDGGLRLGERTSS